MIALLYFWFAMGFWFSDVIADAVIAEKIKLEPSHDKGKLQSLCYACRFFMLMVTISIITFSGGLINIDVAFQILCILPLVILLPSIYHMKEKRIINSHPPISTLSSPSDSVYTSDVIYMSSLPSVYNQLMDVWDSICTQSIWQPMSFVYIYTVFQVGNAAWNQYLYTTLHFTSLQINSLLVLSYILLYIGIMIYKTYMIHWNWRCVYILCTIMNALFSVLQILLILQINQQWGISNYLFSLGDGAISQLFYGLHYLPTLIMMGHLCPKGTEGTTYAMFTSINNSAIMLSSAISISLLSIWDVSKPTLAQHHTNGLMKLTILTSCLQCVGLCFIQLLPNNVEELRNIHYHKSTVAGYIFICILGSSISWSLFSSIMNILHPGWQGDS